jgi:hypothetical protein
MLSDGSASMSRSTEVGSTGSKGNAGSARSKSVAAGWRKAKVWTKTAKALAIDVPSLP